MVVLDSFSYFVKEYIDLLLLFIAIGLCTKIREKTFYILLLLLSFPITLLSMTDTLVTGIVITVLFFLLRYRLWKIELDRSLDEVMGFFIGLASYAIIPLFSSIIVTAIFKTRFNVTTEKGYLFAIAAISLDILFFIAVLLFINKKVPTRSIPMDEKRVYTMQLGVFLALVYLFAEILIKMEVLGVFRIIMVGFLVAQFSFTAFLTYLTLKKNREKNEVENLKKQMDIMNSYTTEVEKNYQEMQKFRHDYKNLLLGLKVDRKEIEINQTYLDEVFDYSHQMMDTSVMRFSGISNIKLTALKSLIITKLSQAEQANLNVSFECISPINEINLDEVKLVRTLGILIDNAMEAAAESEQRKLTLLFIDSPESIEITIENSYFGKLPSFKLMSTQGFSSKGTGRGLGLANIHEIIKEHPQMEMDHYADNGLFVTSLNIRKGDGK
ncbi:sensor histidine kinase [Enterococcus raffinosus]|uniref:sensor histidine kinase n=1 Tax=Enterococcus raffinosus TaxID=71452 RepID=UPI00209EC8AB|nr:GHKL domain-containing protein [Enterococcus raffinosus]